MDYLNPDLSGFDYIDITWQDPKEFEEELMIPADIVSSHQSMLAKLSHLNRSAESYKRSASAKANISAAKMGTKRSDESRIKQSESVKGDNNHFYGKTHNAATRKKMSDIKKKAQLGSNNTNAKSVMYNGVVYGTYKEMTEKTGISKYLINKMVHTGEVKRVI